MRMATVLNKLLPGQGLWVRGLRIDLEERRVWKGPSPIFT